MYSNCVLIITEPCSSLLSTKVLSSCSDFTILIVHKIFPSFAGIDGCVARRLGQCSAFGAWVSFEVVC